MKLGVLSALEQRIGLRYAMTPMTAEETHRIADAGRVRKKSSDLVRERKAVKFAAIADWADSDEFPVDFMCRELGVSRPGHYAWRPVPGQMAVFPAAITHEIALVRAAGALVIVTARVRFVASELAWMPPW